VADDIFGKNQGRTKSLELQVNCFKKDCKKKKKNNSNYLNLPTSIYVYIMFLHSHIQLPL